MAIYFILAISAGLLLGSRFNVLILMPAIAGAVAAVAGVGIARAEDPWFVGFAALGVALALQIGYLLGSSIPYAHQVTRKLADRVAHRG